MKWLIIFLVCGQEICTTYVSEVRYLSQPQCRDALQQSSPYKTFKLNEDKDKVLAKYCTPEAELSHLTKQVVEDL